MITLSPVHLWATFRRDVDVISASCSSKATLRAAADEFTARHQNVTYFPAFEMATIFRPILGEPFLLRDGKTSISIRKPWPLSWNNFSSSIVTRIDPEPSFSKRDCEHPCKH